MFGWDGELTATQTVAIAAAKRVIYDAFESAVRLGCRRQRLESLSTNSSGLPFYGMLPLKVI